MQELFQHHDEKNNIQEKPEVSMEIVTALPIFIITKSSTLDKFTAKFSQFQKLAWSWLWVKLRIFG